MMKTFVLVAMLAACGGGSSRHLLDATGYDVGSGSGVPHPCALQVASTEITGDTGATGGSCTPSAQSQTAFGLMFLAPATNGDSAMGELGCHLADTTIPQTIGFSTTGAGCSAIEIDYQKVGNGILDSWDGDASSTITITVTDLSPLSGTIQMSFPNDSNAMGIALTVSGTF